MKLHTANSPWTMRLVFAFSLCFAVNAAYSQVNVINKPFRSATTNTGAQPAQDLGITPYTPQGSAQGFMAPVPFQPAPNHRVDQVPPQQGNFQPGPPPFNATGYATAMLPQRWDVYAEDQKLSRALQRWTAQERLQFFYEAPKEPVAVRASYIGTFDQVVPALMDDTAASGYPLHACRYDNALRVLHVSQPCPQKLVNSEK